MNPFSVLAYDRVVGGIHDRREKAEAFSSDDRGSVTLLGIFGIFERFSNTLSIIGTSASCRLSFVMKPRAPISDACLEATAVIVLAEYNDFCACGTSRRMILVASMPFIRGMAISIRTISGPQRLGLFQPPLRRQLHRRKRSSQYGKRATSARSFEAVRGRRQSKWSEDSFFPFSSPGRGRARSLGIISQLLFLLRTWFAVRLEREECASGATNQAVRAKVTPQRVSFLPVDLSRLSRRSSGGGSVDTTLSHCRLARRENCNIQAKAARCVHLVYFSANTNLRTGEQPQRFGYGCRCLRFAKPSEGVAYHENTFENDSACRGDSGECLRIGSSGLLRNLNRRSTAASRSSRPAGRAGSGLRMGRLATGIRWGTITNGMTDTGPVLPTRALVGSRLTTTAVNTLQATGTVPTAEWNTIIAGTKAMTATSTTTIATITTTTIR